MAQRVVQDWGLREPAGMQWKADMRRRASGVVDAWLDGRKGGKRRCRWPGGPEGVKVGRGGWLRTARWAKDMMLR